MIHTVVRNSLPARGSESVVSVSKRRDSRKSLEIVTHDRINGAIERVALIGLSAKPE